MLGTNNQINCWANFGLTNSEQAIARTATRGLGERGFRASQTHLCKVAG